MIQLHIGERYRIHGSLGAGTGGIIYLGEERASGEKVAIKHFRQAAGANRPALQEVSAIMGIDHPNIIRCIDFFYLGAGELYLVYEYANGGNLREYLERNGKLDLALALEWTRQVLSGLEYLHGMGLVHCDLKPENILFHREKDETLRVKLGDLGVAHYVSQIAGDKTIAGSPAYMAPERFYDTFSYNSDLYSLGIVLYEMLAGDRPFHGGPADVARRHLREPVNYSKIENPRVKDILSGLLDKDPKYRLQTARDVLVMVDAMVTRRQASKLIRLREEKPVERNVVSVATLPEKGSFIEASRFTIKLHMDRMHPLMVKDRPVLVGEYGTHLEFMDGFTGESLHHFIPNVGLTVQTLSEGSLVYSTRSRICVVDADTFEEKTLVEECTRVFGMHWDPVSRTVLWADAKKGYASSIDYKTCVSMPVQNFGLTAHPRIFPDKCFLYSSGPINPGISIFESSGKPLKRIDLDGAVLDMTSQGDCLLIVTLSRDTDGGMMLYSLDRDLNLNHVVVPPDFDYFTLSGNAVYFLGKKGEVILYGESLVSEVLFKSPPGTHSIYVSPDNHFLYCTKEMGKETEIICFENRPTTSVAKKKARKRK